VDLYLDMLGKQLTYDALKIIGFDADLMQAMAGEMQFMQGLAHAGKIAQGLFVARKAQ
jgi:ABC-type amino acid transport substrate-binding protein